MGKAIGSLFGMEQPKAQPIIPQTPPPPTVDIGMERQTVADRLRFRRGAAATRFAAPGAGQGRVGVFKALGGA